MEERNEEHEMEGAKTPSQVSSNYIYFLRLQLEEKPSH